MLDQKEIDKLRQEIRILTSQISDLKVELTKKEDNIKDIHNSAILIASSFNLENILAWFLETAIKTASSEVGCIMLTGEDEIAREGITWGMSSAFLKSIKLKKTNRDLIEEILKTGESILIDNLEDFYVEGDEINAMINTLIGLPLKAKGKILGALFLVNKINPDEKFTFLDNNKLSTLSDFASVSIENARLHNEALITQQYERDLAIAEDIQISILPQKSLEVPGLEFAYKYKAAKKIGGDYYDFFKINENKIGIIIGDVSNKGVPAALIMTATRAVLRSEVLMNNDPASVMKRANNLIYEDINKYTEMFVTLFYGCLDLEKKEFSYTNAGHCWPFVVKQNVTEEIFLKKGGVFLGLFEGNDYEQGKIILDPGDLMVFYTDGITEAMNKKEEIYGDPRLQTLIKENKTRTIDELINIVYNDILDFADGADQSDDMALLLVKAGEQ